MSRASETCSCSAMCLLLLFGAVWSDALEDGATCALEDPATTLGDVQPRLMLQTSVKAVAEVEGSARNVHQRQSGMGDFGRCPHDFPWAYRPKKGLDRCCKEPLDLDGNQRVEGVRDKWQRSESCAPGWTACERRPCADFEEDLSAVPEPLRLGAEFQAASSPDIIFAANGMGKLIFGRGATECKDDVGEEDSVGDLGLAVLKYGDSCYATKGYSNSDYQVDAGLVLDGLPAYTVHPPAVLATAWVAGGTGIYYKFPTKQDYKVYAVQDGSLNLMVEVPGAAITVGEFTKTGVKVNALTTATTFVFVPSSTQVHGPVERVISDKLATECDMSKLLQSTVGDLAVVVMKYGDGRCYTGCTYNSCDYKVVRGDISRRDESAPAYVVYPPATIASQWVASKTKLMYKTQQHDDLLVLLYNNESLMVWSVIEKINFTAGDWVDVDVVIHDLSEPSTFVFIHLGDSTTASSTTTTTTTAATNITTVVTTTTTTTQTTTMPTTTTTTVPTTVTTTTVTTTTAATTTITTIRPTITTTLATTTNTGETQASACSLNPLTTYDFTVATSDPLEFAPGGPSGNLSGTTATECDNNVGVDHAVGRLALVLTEYGGTCWKGGGYNCKHYVVKEGKVGELLAYQVSAPAHQATNWVASKQVIYYQFETQVDHDVYKLQGGELKKVGSVEAASITVGAFVSLGVYANVLTADAGFVILPASQADDVPVPASRVIVGTEATACDESRLSHASLGDVAVVTMRYGDTCWTDGRYNHKNFLLERGNLVGADGSSYAVYNVHPPELQPSSWSASGANLYFKMPQQHELAIYQFDGKVLKKAGTVPANETAAGAWVDTGISIHKFVEPMVYLFVADGSRVSSWPLLSSSVEGALLAQGGTFRVCGRTFPTPGHPFVPSVDWTQGPGTHSGNYGIPKQFYAVSRSDGHEGVVWQDETALSVHCTWFSQDLLSSETQTLTSTDERLYAVASDGQDSIALLLMARNRPEDKSAAGSGRTVVVSAATGSISREAALDCDRLNYHVASVGASMVWNIERGTIGAVLGRLMKMGGDGLNHQGAIGFVLNATTLEIIQTAGMSSHSFANSLIETSDTNFLAMDLGDNYPRGINLRRFNEQSGSRKGFVCYYMKTKHATSATRGSTTFDPYPEISDNETQYYKWSNDNYIYTEIGHPGVVEVNNGVIVFFAGEQPSLDNSKVGTVLNAPRNLGFVKVSKDVGDKQILSAGPTETGGFYTYGGTWSEQVNQGVNFITNFTDITDSVSRLKTAQLGPDHIVLLWEVWTKTEFKKTQMMVVDSDGQVVVSPWTSDFPIQLAIQDDVVIRDGKVIAYAGNLDGRLVRYEICSGCQ